MPSAVPNMHECIIISIYIQLRFRYLAQTRLKTDLQYDHMQYGDWQQRVNRAAGKSVLETAH